MAHGERLAEGAGQRSRRRQRARDLRGRQVALRRGVGQPVVLPAVARADAGQTRRGPAGIPRRQHPLGARRLDARRRAGRRRAGAQTTNIVKIDPKTLSVREIVRSPGTPAFAAGTVAVEIGNQLWVGSFRGDRLSRSSRIRRARSIRNSQPDPEPTPNCSELGSELGNRAVETRMARPHCRTRLACPVREADL